MGLIKDIDVEPVFMGVAECDFAVGVLGHQTVNSPAIVFGQLASNARLQSGKRAADGERGIEAQREAGCERWTEFPAVGLRASAHHLQLAAGNAAVAKVP